MPKAKIDFKFSPNGYDIENYVAGQHFPHTGDLLEQAVLAGQVEREGQTQKAPQKKTLKSTIKEIGQIITKKLS